MAVLVTVAFLLAVAGGFLLLGLSPFSFLEGMAGYFRPKRQTLKSKVMQSRRQRQPKGLKRLFLETGEVLRVTGKSGRFAMLCILSMFLFVVGVLVALTVKNGYLVPVLAVGFSLLPFYYIKFTAGRFKRQVSTELGEHLEAARGSMRVQELLGSPWAKEARQRYRTMAGRQEISGEPGGMDAAQDEMEER